jgi:hypothetical protein
LSLRTRPCRGGLVVAAHGLLPRRACSYAGSPLP